MTFMTQHIRVALTYTEAAGAVGTNSLPGSASSVFDKWAASNAGADAQIANQFSNMDQGGRSYVITGHTLLGTRPHAPLEP